MATTAASIFFSVPGIALAIESENNEDEGEVGISTFIGDTTTNEEEVLDAPVVEAKEKTIEYTVQDFSMALPTNWKVITKYDEKKKKASTTPTLFSAIDLNSGAVLSVVREQACSVSDYAKSSFETTSTNKKKKNSPVCDFALQGESPALFQPGSYEKDASKLLIRHDDRDNAVLRGVSTLEESQLDGNGGVRLLASEDNQQTDSYSYSYSSPLLELRALTTIPTSGTYTDTMGLQQPNTIDRKVLAKAVATTTRVTRMVDASTENVSPPSSKSTLLATDEEADRDESSTETEDSEAVASSSSSTTATITTPTKVDSLSAEVTTEEEPENPSDSTTTNTITTTTKVDSLSGKVTTEEEPENPSDSIPSSISTEKVVTASSASSFETKTKQEEPKASEPSSFDENEGNSVETSKTVASTEAPATRASERILDVDDESADLDTSNKAADGVTDTSENQPLITAEEPTGASAPTADNSSLAAMMAMAGTIVDEESTSDTPLSADEIEKAVETAMEKAIETAIEAVRDSEIEPTIEAITETAKEAAKEMAMDLLKGNNTKNNDSQNKNTEAETIAKTITEPTIAADQDSLPEEALQASVTSESSAMDSEEMDASPDATIVASASSAETPVDEPPSVVPTTTTTTTVLSIWLSAPLDEWQKPVMGTRLNQIWESVQYDTSDIVEGSMPEEGDDSINTQLLLLNNKTIR